MGTEDADDRSLRSLLFDTLDKLWSLMLQYFVCGGLPEAVLAWHTGQTKLEKIALIKDVQNRIYRDYLADIAKYSGNENATHIESILTNIPSQLVREADGNASKFQFKNVIKGKKSFEELRGPIDWLRRAGLIHQVFIAEKGLAPLTAYIKENRFKLYLFNLGILRHLANFQPHELMKWGDNMYKGFYAENFVLNELLTRKIALPKAWREGDSEIEFLVECSKGIVPIDLKSGYNRRSKSLSIFKARYHPKESYVLAGKQFSGVSSSNKKEGTLTRPLFVIPARLQE